MKRGLHEKKTLAVRDQKRDNELEVKERLHEIMDDVGKKKGALKTKAPLKDSKDLSPVNDRI